MRINTAVGAVFLQQSALNLVVAFLIWDWCLCAVLFLGAVADGYKEQVYDVMFPCRRNDASRRSLKGPVSQCRLRT